MILFFLWIIDLSKLGPSLYLVYCQALDSHPRLKPKHALKNLRLLKKGRQRKLVRPLWVHKHCR